jgi:DNA-binding beta-propeller fold protein YncE
MLGKVDGSKSRAARKLLIFTAATMALGGLSGCGGGGSKSGAGAVKVTVTGPGGGSAAVVSLNARAQFAATVTGVKGVPIATNNGAVRSSNTVTITTTQAHNLSAGNRVSITGVTDATFNGTFTVDTVPSTTTFTYTQTAADATSGKGTASNVSVNWFVNEKAGGDASIGLIDSTGLYTAPSTLPPPVTATIAASNGAVRKTNKVTITTTAKHELLQGQIVTISGVTDTSFNGTFAIASVPSDTTFTYNQTGSDATSGSGTVASFSAKVKAKSVADSTAEGTAVVVFNSGIVVSVLPTLATVGTGESFTFTVSVTGDSQNLGVDWSVKETNAGTIDANGKYTAPATLPNPATIAATNGAVRKTNVVTVTTTAAHGFTTGHTVVISGVTDTSFNGTFTIASVPSSTTFTYNQVGADASSGGGTATSPLTATILAVSKADLSKSATATVTVVTAVPPTFSGISPSTAPQGGLFQDVYLIAGNLRSTSVVNFNGVPVQSSQLKIISSTLARVRLTDAQLAVANTSPGFPFDVVGATPPPCAPACTSLKVVPVRPALLQSIPDSAQQNAVATSITMDGGYFGPPASPVASAAFNGSTRAVSLTSARRLTMTLNPGDQATPGLYQVSVQNPAAPQPAAVSNFAVQPDPASNGPSFSGTIPTGAGSSPSAIAVDSALGVAIVALRGTNSVQLIDMKPATPALLGSPISLAPATAPTGVAVDSIRHIAAVVNNGSKSVSIIDLSSGSVLGTIDLSTVTTASPFSVGIDPYSGLGLVAYQSTNSASIINLDAAATPTCVIGTAPYCVIGTVTANTGANPQVAFEPRLRWAFVTPGGAGLLSIVDLGQQTTKDIDTIQRAGNAVTVKTTANHGIDPANPGSVLISGVPVSSFNGTFTVTGVPDATTFTYAQSGPDENSSGGKVNYARPLATFSLGINVRGISINPETNRALLVDPTVGSAQAFVLSTLDQTNTAFSLNTSTSEFGATATGFQPFTNVGVIVNPSRNEISLVDPVKPQRLAVISTNGTGSGAVVVDPPSNLALVANSTSDDVSIISLGSIKPLHVSEVLIPSARRLIPGVTLTSTTDLPVTIIGAGLSGALVRLDGTTVGGGTASNGGRQLDVTIPASFLAAPRRFALDVVNGGINSNAVGLTVAQTVDVTGTGCATPQPGAVAIDAEREKAIVANTGCDNVSLIDLNTGLPTQIIAVGSKPSGVAVDSRLGLAVVANTGDSSTPGNTVSIVDLVANNVKAAPTVGSQPLGVAIDPDSGKAVVTNLVSNTISVIDLNATTPTAATGAVNQRPIAVAVDPERRIAVVANAQSGVIDIMDISGAVPTRKASLTTSSLPTGVAFDAATGLFYVASSLGNTVFVVNPDTPSIALTVRVGVNPTSLAYNFQTGTLVTTNTASNTISVVDSQTFTTRATLGIGASPQFAVAIHPRSNLAVIADQANNRVLILPLPR